MSSKVLTHSKCSFVGVRREGWRCFKWRSLRQFAGMCCLRGTADGSGARVWAEPGHDRQDVPVFGSAGLSAQQTPEEAEAGALLPVIDAILASDHSAPSKQRHTAQRIFERLRSEYGYAGGYTVVKDYVRLKRVRMKEAFVPLSHPPGHAQVDFGQCIGVIGGVRT